MAQSSNLTISIGADSTKLRADLALAQASLRQFAAELRAAAAEARQTGETTQVTAAAQRYEAAAQRVRAFTQQIRDAARAHGEAAPLVTALGQRFGELGSKLREVGTAIGEAGDRIFPHFREIATFSIAAASAAFVKLTTDAARATSALTDTAAAIGISADKLLAIQFAGAKAGVSTDLVNASLERIARLAGAARLEMDKMQGQLGGSLVLGGSTASGIGQFGNGVEVARGNLNGLTKEARAAADAMASFGGDMNHAVSLVRGGVKPVLDTSDAFKTLGIDLRRFSDTAEGTNALTEEIATRIDAMADSTRKAHIASQLLGRNWAEQLPLLVDFRQNVREAQETIERYSLATSAAEKTQAQAYAGALYTLTSVFDRIKTITGNILGTSLVPLFEGLTKALGENQVAIRAWAQSVADNLAPAMRDLVTLLREGLGAKFETQTFSQAAQILRILAGIVREVTTAFRGLVSVLDLVAVAINKVFGTEFTGTGLLVLALVLRITGVFRLLGVAVSATLAFFRLFGPVEAIFARLAASGAWATLLRFLGPAGLIGAGLVWLIGKFKEAGAAADAAGDKAKGVTDKPLPEIAYPRRPPPTAAEQTAAAEREERRAGQFPPISGGASRATGPGGMETDAEYFARTGFHYGARTGEPRPIATPPRGMVPIGGFDPTRPGGPAGATAQRVNIQAGSVEVTTSTTGTGAAGGIAQTGTAARGAGGPSGFDQLLNDIRTKAEEYLQQDAALIDQIKAGWSEWAAWFDGINKDLRATATNTWTFISDGWAKAATDTQSAASSIWNAIKSALSASVAGGPAGTGSPMAAGGYVSGPGTSTSDSILARLSNGEFVVRAAAVQRVGRQYLEGLNRFAEGGPVGARRAQQLRADVTAIWKNSLPPLRSTAQVAANWIAPPPIRQVAAEIAATWKNGLAPLHSTAEVVASWVAPRLAAVKLATLPTIPILGPISRGFAPAATAVRRLGAGFVERLSLVQDTSRLAAAASVGRVGIVLHDGISRFAEQFVPARRATPETSREAVQRHQAAGAPSTPEHPTPRTTEPQRAAEAATAAGKLIGMPAIRFIPAVTSRILERINRFAGLVITPQISRMVTAGLAPNQDTLMPARRLVATAAVAPTAAAARRVGVALPEAVHRFAGRGLQLIRELAPVVASVPRGGDGLREIAEIGASTRRVFMSVANSPIVETFKHFRVDDLTTHARRGGGSAAELAQARAAPFKTIVGVGRQWATGFSGATLAATAAHAIASAPLIAAEGVKARLVPAVAAVRRLGDGVIAKVNRFAELVPRGRIAQFFPLPSRIVADTFSPIAESGGITPPLSPRLYPRSVLLRDATIQNWRLAPQRLGAEISAAWQSRLPSLHSTAEVVANWIGPKLQAVKSAIGAGPAAASVGQLSADIIAIRNGAIPPLRARQLGIDIAATWHNGLSPLQTTAIESVQPTLESAQPPIRRFGREIASLWNGIKSSVHSTTETASNLIAPRVDALKSAIAIAASDHTAGPELRAAGGGVRGPGSGTSDSILARVSNGEFIIKAASVAAVSRRLGAGFLEGLNHFAEGGLEGLNHFATGGLVGAPPIRFAEGGLASVGDGGRVAANFHFESGNSFKLTGPGDVVGAMVKEAHAQQMRSAGTKPSWFAGRPGGR